MDWVSGITSLIGAISTQVQEAQKFDATIKSARATTMEKLNALDAQYNQLLQAKDTLKQAIAIAEQEALKAENTSKIDYTKVGIYFGVGLIISIILKYFIKK